MAKHKKPKVNTKNNKYQQNKPKSQTLESTSAQYHGNINLQLNETAVEDRGEGFSMTEDRFSKEQPQEQSGNMEVMEQKEEKLVERFKRALGFKESRFSKVEYSGDIAKVDSAYLQVLETQLDNIQEYLMTNIEEFARVEEKLTKAQSKVLVELKTEMSNSHQYIHQLREQLHTLQANNANSFEILSTGVTNHFEQLKTTLAKLDHAQEIIREIKSSNGQVINLKHDLVAVAKQIHTVSDTISDHVLKEIRSVKNKLEELPDTIDEDLNLTKRLKGIEKTTETIQGALQTLQNQDQSEMKELLQDKTVSFKKEFPAMNEEEETIIELTKYSEYITEQLSIAARHYARNRQVIANIHEERNRHGQQLKDAKAQAHLTGMTEGKTAVIRQLLANYQDVHTLFESNNEEVQILVSFLKNQGLSVDEELPQGTVVEITDEMRPFMELKASFEGLGHFEVVKPAYLLQDGIYQKAVFVPYVESNIDDTVEPLVDKVEVHPEASNEDSEFDHMEEDKPVLGTEQPQEESNESKQLELDEADVNNGSEPESGQDNPKQSHETEETEEKTTIISE